MYLTFNRGFTHLLIFFEFFFREKKTWKKVLQQMLFAKKVSARFGARVFYHKDAWTSGFEQIEKKKQKKNWNDETP